MLAENKAIRMTMKRFGVAHQPTVQSLVEDVGLATAEAFSSLNASAMKTVLLSLRDNIDPNLPARPLNRRSS